MLKATCPTCDGIGAQAGAHTYQVNPCPGCGGTGTVSWTHEYRWGNNAQRFKGLRCRIVASGTLGTVLVEFETGERTTTSRRALRRFLPAGGAV